MYLKNTRKKNLLKNRLASFIILLCKNIHKKCVKKVH